MFRLRRNLLFCPASNAKLLASAHTRRPDCIVFDLEDSVTFTEKQNARKMLCESLQTVDRSDIEIFVRINPQGTPFYEDDVREIVKAGARNIRLPMCEKKEHVTELADMLQELERELVPGYVVKIACSFETPRGVMSAMEIASASERVTAVSFGAEDYLASLGVARSAGAEQLLYARSHIAIVANICGVSAFDTVFTDTGDAEGFLAEAKLAQALGFSGKSCIHPSQLALANSVFSPSEREIEYSQKVLDEAEKAQRQGLGVFLLDGKMIDAPIIDRAKQIIEISELIQKCR